MASQWYVSEDGQSRQGPLTTDQLRKLVDLGRVRPNTMLWKDGVGRWVRARQVKGLFDGQGVPSGSSADVTAVAPEPEEASAANQPRPARAWWKDPIVVIGTLVPTVILVAFGIYLWQDHEFKNFQGRLRKLHATAQKAEAAGDRRAALEGYRTLVALAANRGHKDEELRRVVEKDREAIRKLGREIEDEQRRQREELAASQRRVEEEKQQAVERARRLAEEQNRTALNEAEERRAQAEQVAKKKEADDRAAETRNREERESLLTKIESERTKVLKTLSAQIRDAQARRSALSRRLKDHVKRQEFFFPGQGSQKDREYTRLERAREAVAEELDQLINQVEKTKFDFEQQRRRVILAHNLPGDPEFIVERNLILTREELETMQARAAELGSPEGAADAYIQELIKKGVIKSATFTRTSAEAPPMERAMFPSQVKKYRTVHYIVVYVSRGGIVNEREAYVSVLSPDGKNWYVSNMMKKTAVLGGLP